MIDNSHIMGSRDVVIDSSHAVMSSQIQQHTEARDAAAVARDDDNNDNDGVVSTDSILGNPSLLGCNIAINISYFITWYE